MSETDPGVTGLGVYQLKPAGRPWPDLPAQADALTDPSDETIAETLFALLPRGSAWRSPDGAAFDGNSRLGGFWRGVAGILADTYRRAFELTQESTASTLIDGLTDWETEFGLPDPCVDRDLDLDGRVRALLARVRSLGVITVLDFVALAADLGYAITIEEPQPFECGVSDCGGTDEISGGDEPVEYYWIVMVAGSEPTYFEAGVGEAGVTPLTDFETAPDLECLFRRLAPAWTQPVFDYS